MSAFLEILEWSDHGASELVHRVPAMGSADIKMGAQLIVNESQRALFFRDGKCMDQFGPGRHVLSTMNLPLLTRFLALPYGFTSPFRTAVYFVNQKVFSDLKWGTKNPVVFRDRELGVVRLRGYGRFNLRVIDAPLFLNTVVGARAEFDVGEIEDYFRDVIVARLNDILGEQLQSLYDLPALYNELGAAAKVRLQGDFSRYGCELAEFYVNSITPPEAVQEMIDERSSLKAVGNLDDFLRFEAARAVGGHGGAGGSTTGAAVEAGLGAGLGLALVPNLLSGMTRGLAAGSGAGTALTDGPDVKCQRCSAQVATGARFCPSCGQDRTSSDTCTGCQGALPPKARFCPACGRPAR
jgi:membrane protease subunit (stomatin/prohibitin family)